MNIRSPKTLAILDAAIAQAKREETKTKKKARERNTGRYAAENNWDRLCVCGHTLGDHTAETVGGERPCISADVTHVQCECLKFRQKKVKGVNAYGVTLLK